MFTRIAHLLAPLLGLAAVGATPTPTPAPGGTPELQAQADPVGGPQQAIEIVQPLTSDYYTVTLRAGELTIIALSGSGTSDLDLYLYDENGNLIEQDLGMNDSARVSVVPRWTGPFRVRVQNRGMRPNLYRLDVF